MTDFNIMNKALKVAWIPRLQTNTDASWKIQICPGLNANEMHVLYDRHYKVSSLIKVHQNTPNSVKYEVIWKCQITQSNMKYLLNNT